MRRLLFLFILTTLISSAYLVLSSKLSRGIASANTPKTVLKLGGSQSISNLVEMITDQFRKNNPDIEVQSFVKDQSSGLGIKLLIEGEVDVARSSRPLKEEEIKKAAATGGSIRSHRIGYDALAIVTSKESAEKIQSLTMTQIKEIFFSEKIKRWNQIIPNMKGNIHVYVNIESGGSGTLDVFLEKVANDTKAKFRKDAYVVHQISDLKSNLQKDPEAISYLSFYDIPDGLGAIPIKLGSGYISRVSSEDIRIAKYPISRELYLVTMGHSKPEALKFVEFALSPKGQDIVSKLGIIPVIGYSK